MIWNAAWVFPKSYWTSESESFYTEWRELIFNGYAEGAREKKQLCAERTLTREDARYLGKKAFDGTNGNSIFFILHACYDVFHLNNNKIIKAF